MLNATTSPSEETLADKLNKEGANLLNNEEKAQEALEKFN
jgi:hypothetical protein